MNTSLGWAGRGGKLAPVPLFGCPFVRLSLCSTVPLFGCPFVRPSLCSAARTCCSGIPLFSMTHLSGILLFSMTHLSGILLLSWKRGMYPTNLIKPREKPDHLEHIGVQDLNNHYASISTVPAYQEVTKKITANPQLHYLNEQQIFKVLDQLRPTTEGIDHLPHWFLRLLAPICVRSLASLINLSLGCSYVPLQWKMAVIHPAPKIKTPVGPSTAPSRSFPYYLGWLSGWLCQPIFIQPS